MHLLIRNFEPSVRTRRCSYIALQYNVALFIDGKVAVW